MSTAITAQHLVAIFESLPKERAMQLFDFARFLRDSPSPSPNEPARGSAESLLKALDEIGTLQFESGELEGIMADINGMRQFDLEAEMIDA